MKTRSFTVILYKEDDLYIAECPEVGTVDQGETIKQAIADLNLISSPSRIKRLYKSAVFTAADS